MSAQKYLSRPLKGFSFELPDLIMLLAWSEFHDIEMVIELDHCVEGEEYEEVIAFHAKFGALRRWIMWCTKREVVVQPLIGKPRRFCTVSEAMEVLAPVRGQI